MPRSQEYESRNESEKRLEFTQEEKEKLQEQIERSVEKEKSKEASSSERLDDAKKEALELAKSAEKNKSEKGEVASKEKSIEKRKNISKKDKDAAVDRTLKTIQSEMNPASKSFSKFIHAKPVEAVSEAAGRTIARPNALLFGSASAFILTLAVYLITKHFGYSLSGTEGILTFAAGWFLGILIDYIRITATGGRS